MKGSCGIVICALILSLSLHASDSIPLSSGGCTCKSRCDKSWHGSGMDWCYVEPHCITAGWDTCPTMETLYESAVNDKEQEKTKREGVEKELAESKLNAAALKRQLSISLAHEEKAARNLEEAKQKSRNVGSKVDVEHKAEEKMKEIEKAEHEAEAKLKENQEKLAQAWSKESDTEKQLQEVKGKVKDAEAQSEGKVRDAQGKAKDAEAKVKSAGIRHHEDVLKLSDSELRQAGVEKKLKRAEAQAQDSDVKLRGATKALLKFKAASQEANTKLNEMAHKLENEEILEKNLTLRLNATETKLAVAQKKAVEADAELRPFRVALRSAVKSRVFGKL